MIEDNISYILQRIANLTIKAPQYLRAIRRLNSLAAGNNKVCFRGNIYIGLGGISQDPSMPDCLDGQALSVIKISNNKLKQQAYLPVMTNSPDVWRKQVAAMNIEYVGEEPFSKGIVGRVKGGCRGIFIFGDYLYCCAWGAIYEIDLKSFRPVRVLTHHWMSDLHDIFIDDAGILCCTTLMDAVIWYDFKAKPIDVIFFIETSFVPGEVPIDRQNDMRWRGKLKRGNSLFQPNGISKDGDSYIVTGRGYNGAVRVRKQLNKLIAEPLIKGTQGCHDGIVLEGYYITNQSDAFNVAIYESSSNLFVRNIYPMGKLRKKNFFYRGLAVTPAKTLLIGCSPHDNYAPDEDSFIVEVDLAGNIVSRLNLANIIKGYERMPTIMSGGIALDPDYS